MSTAKAPTRMKKGELKSALLGRGYKEEEIAKKKRPELIELLSSSNGDELRQEAEDEMMEEMRELTNPHDTEDITPSHPEWTQFVLGKFMDDELDGENPRVEGLRRVAEELLGDIVEEGCDLVDPPSMENGMRACAKSWVVFSNGSENKRFEALADACENNVSPDYAMYLCAMADTRAKGRCYRNALKLRRIVSAEEIGVGGSFGRQDTDEDAIQTGQITAIRMLADRLGVSILKLVEDLEMNCQKTESGAIDLNSLDRASAQVVVKRLNELRQTRVPDKLKRE